MDQLNQILIQRRKKADELAEMSVELYANDFKPTHHISEVLSSASANETLSEIEESSGVRTTFQVAGRILAMRKFGKASFLHIQDETGKIIQQHQQIHLRLVDVPLHDLHLPQGPRIRSAARSLR